MSRKPRLLLVSDRWPDPPDAGDRQRTSLMLDALLSFADHPVLFVILSGLVFFAWGEIYSLFPATCTDIYGRKFATTNYGMLYTAKGTASLLVPLSSVLAAATGSWQAVFIAASAVNAAAALMAWFVLRPMRRKHIEQSRLSQ